jgi:GNAT superfamily N-acetyltransferase
VTQQQIDSVTANGLGTNGPSTADGLCDSSIRPVAFASGESSFKKEHSFGPLLQPHSIQIAETDEEILSTYDAMRNLHPEIPREDYLFRVRLLESEQNYTIAALRIDGRVVSVAGFRLCRSLGWGRFLYVDDLVTDAEDRSTGCGGSLFAWLVQRAKDENCTELRLDSAVFRTRAHRFYFLQHMDIACFHFRIAIAQK